MRVAVYFDPPSRRSRGIASYMAAGIERVGDSVYQTGRWKFDPDADVAVAYGWGHPELFEAYRAAGKHFVYVDLGWWDRKPEGMVMEGYHKVCVDAREPTAYFRRNSPPDRFARFKFPVKQWRMSGDHILLAGMSEKSAGTRGFKPYEWELAALAEIRRATDRRVLYRPKPSWIHAMPIASCDWSPPTDDIQTALAGAWAVVTLHSNVAVDALLAGIPVHVIEGVASGFSTPINMIEVPSTPDGREQLLADIAYCQFNTCEMRSGECWRYLKERTPLCAS